MIDKSLIDPTALQFYRVLKEGGFSAYFVGGSVRDLLLGKKPKDFDIATNATPHQIKRVIPQGRIIGRRFRHVMLERNGGRYEIVTFRGPVVPAEAEEMADEAEGIDAIGDEGGDDQVAAAPDRFKKHPDLNQFGNAEQDAKRRDFTINALFYDPDADELVDYVEGKLDIDQKVIRSIGDALVRLEEDPIRILRAIRHKIKLSLNYDSSLEHAMKEKGPLLESTSKDRIREEFLKVCLDQSMGEFLQECRKFNLTNFVMPWFEGISDENWNAGVKFWQAFSKMPPYERMAPDFGLAIMLTPLIESLVIKPYKDSAQESEKNYLPDMKYFLSCEPLRNFMLRNLRISRAQTDHIVRGLFYYSRMTGLWLEQGPPRRVIGRLFQHPSAVLAARMARLRLQMDAKEIPDWMKDLADYVHGGRRGHHDRDEDSEHGEERGPRDQDRDHRNDDRDSRRAPHQGNRSEYRGDNRNEGREEYRSQEGDESAPQSKEEGEQYQSPQGGDREEPEEAPAPQMLPPPDKPMVWNGPLHAPVVRPIFNEEPVNRWTRNNQTIRAYRASGIPNPPVDHTFGKMNLMHNYKPEILETAKKDDDSEQDNRNSRPRREFRDRDGGDRGGRGRNRERGNRNDRGGRGGRDRGGDRSHDRGGFRGAHRGNGADDQGDRPRHHSRHDSHRGPSDRQEEFRGRDNSRGPEDFANAPQGNDDLAPQNPGADLPYDHEEEAMPPQMNRSRFERPKQEFYDEDEDDNFGNRVDSPPPRLNHLVSKEDALLSHQMHGGYDPNRAENTRSHHGRRHGGGGGGGRGGPRGGGGGRGGPRGGGGRGGPRGGGGAGGGNRGRFPRSNNGNP